MPSAAAATPIRIASSSGAWVEIRQADGSIVYSGTLKAGVAEAVGGTTPFSLVIGNASSVTLEFQGKTIPLGSPASNVVRMKLP